MNLHEVASLYQDLTKLNVKLWLDGGWAVDALLEKQTRPHEDVDIVIQEKDVSVVRKYLENLEYHDIVRDDTRDWNFVRGDSSDHLVDIHVIVFDRQGNGIYGPAEKGVMYPASSLTGNGLIDGVPVNCISPKSLVEFHTGYKLREQDYHDVKLLCEKFKIKLPEEYKV